MSARATRATGLRVVAQLRRDPRTIALIVVVPCVLVFLVDQLFADRPEVFQQVGVPLLGLFPLVSMFLVTSITMLRERTSGTLERLLTLPLAKLDLLLGYGIAFALVATVQATIVSLVGFGLLDLTVVNSKLLVIALAVANAVLGMALGLFLSAFARTEFQAVQFMPAFILPQILLCGLLVPRDQMAEWLQWVSAVMPFTYAYDALSRAANDATLGARFWADVAVTVGVTVLALALGAATLRRRTP
ncbi:MAG TPA: ABC transporter permease [Gaiella sp.]